MVVEWDAHSVVTMVAFWAAKMVVSMAEWRAGGLVQ